MPPDATIEDAIESRDGSPDAHLLPWTPAPPRFFESGDEGGDDDTDSWRYPEENGSAVSVTAVFPPPAGVDLFGSRVDLARIDGPDRNAFAFIERFVSHSVVLKANREHVVAWRLKAFCVEVVLRDARRLKLSGMMLRRRVEEVISGLERERDVLLIAGIQYEILVRDYSCEMERLGRFYLSQAALARNPRSIKSLWLSASNLLLCAADGTRAVMPDLLKLSEALFRKATADDTYPRPAYIVHPLHSV